MRNANAQTEQSGIDAWRRFLADATTHVDVRRVILESWQRSRGAGVNAEEEAATPPRVSEFELAQRLEQAQALVQIARPHLEWLSGQLADIPHVAYVTDADGIILHASGDDEFRTRFGLSPGHDWSEASMGTNGAGTALAADSPVAVIGGEHYLHAFHDCTCTAAPLHRGGKVIGAIDVSTRVDDASPDRLVLVSHIAYVIDRELRDREALERESAYRELAQALRARERRLELAIDVAELGVFTWDLETNRIRSETLRNFAMFGRTPADRPLSLQDFLERFLHPDDRESFERSLRESMHDAKQLRCVCRIRRQDDGKWRWLEIGGEFDRMADGSPSRLVGVIRDVTDQRRLLDALQDADRRKDEFLATLAHELRNPLAAIGNALEFLQLKGSLDPDMQSARDVIQRQTRLLARLVDDLLDLSRITRGRVVLQKQRLSLATALSSAIETCRPGIEKSRHTLDLNLQDAPLHVDGDPARLSQVFANLLNNATKYTPPGGRIRVEAFARGAEAIVRIEDTGIGIPKEMIGRIFDMFVQLDPSTGRSHGGLGIGLTHAEQLVRLHGGTITATSAGTGLGSTFTVKLPLCPAEQHAITTTGAKVYSHAHPAPRRVLIADDNVDAAQSLATLLRALGHETRTACDGLAALEMSQRFAPHLVLLDIGMPDLNGYETARRLRARFSKNELRLVALSGWGRPEDKRRATEAGFDHHLTKPVALDTLQRLLAESQLDC